MRKIAFFDVKPYDMEFFQSVPHEGLEFHFFESKLNAETCALAAGCDAAVAFVNDDIGRATLDALHKLGIRIIALRCSGYNNVDLEAAYGRVHVTRVPAYSPYAVAEHAVSLLCALNRKLHRAYSRTREHNFSLDGLLGRDLYGKTAGIVGTGKIGRVFADICRGFGMRLVAFDPFPADIPGCEYMEFDRLCEEADIISLHCPLTADTFHMVNSRTIRLMKPGALLVNTSRGALIESDALISGLKSGRLGGAALDVYEEEADLFYEDKSGVILQDDKLATLISMPNVILTSHQAYFTREALDAIAKSTVGSLYDWFEGRVLKNEICYRCGDTTCDKKHEKNCF